MKRIKCLNPLIANQIAAGEVVEKAASVVKELVENSIDAKATKIEIEVEGGGIHLIRVRDNGQGIVKEDLPLAFYRHATSKIYSSQDLEAIASLGFRGEALASIASVSKCTLTSKALGSDEAWQVHIQPDCQAVVTLAAHAQGSTIEVRDLFYNTPVRRKFLRSEKSEHLAIEETIKRLALAASHVTFIYKQNQKVIRRYEAASDTIGSEARIGNIVGRAFMAQARWVNFEKDGLKLTGWIGLPDLQKRHADCQYFFVNQRSVKDKLLNHAIRTCYQRDHRIVEGTYPAYVLFLDLDPSEVDVNVHPTKQEVRFSQTLRIHDFIYRAIESAWEQNNGLMKASTTMRLTTTTQPVKKIETMKESLPSITKHQRYIFIEQSEGVRIIDFQVAKKALLQRYIEKNPGTIDKRPLLFPLEIALPTLKIPVEEGIKILKKIGFECRIDNHRMQVFQQPVILEKPLDASSFLELIESIDLSESNNFFIEKLSLLCSHQIVNAFDWSEFDPSIMSSVYLTHEEIEKTSKV